MFKRIMVLSKIEFNKIVFQFRTIFIFLIVSTVIQYSAMLFHQMYVSHTILTQIYEPYVFLLSNRFSMLIIVAGYLFLICNVPFVDNDIHLLLFRIKKIEWMMSRIVVLLQISLIYNALLLGISIIINGPHAFSYNAWSDASYLMAKTQQYSSYRKFITVPYNVLKSISPVGALVNAYFLSILYQWLLALIALLCNIITLRKEGVICSGIIHLAGWLILLDICPPWLYYIWPLPNSILATHAYSFGDNLPSLLFSYIYFIVLISILSCIVILLIKNKKIDISKLL